MAAGYSSAISGGIRQMNVMTVKVDASGRLVIPKEMREELGIADGGTLTLTVENGVLRAQTRLAALRHVQRLLAERAPPGETGSAVDSLIADRRAEAARAEATEEPWAAAQQGRAAGG